MKALIIFRGGATRTNEVAYSDMDPENIPAPDKAYLFDTSLGNGDRVAANYTHDGNTLSYSPPAPPPDIAPKPIAWLSDCTNDNTIPNSANTALHIMTMWFLQEQRGLALDVWNRLQASLSGQPAVITNIRNKATARRINLP